MVVALAIVPLSARATPSKIRVEFHRRRRDSRHMNYHVFETAHGFCGIAWNGNGIARFQLPTSSAEVTERNILRRVPGAVPGTPPANVAKVIAAVLRYFAGEKIDFSEVPLDLNGQDEFFRRIYEALRKIGWGQTTTYGTLAKQLGAEPQAAIDVGIAMSRNPVPLIIPCHRCLAAGNKTRGFSAPGGTEATLRMLELEGIDLRPKPPAQASLF